MNEAFDKVVGFFLAAILLFGVPLLYFSERQESLEQMYLLTVTTEFVDTVRNKGILEKEVYERFLEKTGVASGIYEIHMIYTREHLELVKGKIAVVTEEYYEKQLLEVLYEEGGFSFFKGDFFKVEVVKKTPGAGERLLKFLIKDKEIAPQIVVYYGGCIRNDGG